MKANVCRPSELKSENANLYNEWNPILYKLFKEITKRMWYNHLLQIRFKNSSEFRSAIQAMSKANLQLLCAGVNLFCDIVGVYYFLNGPVV